MSAQAAKSPFELIRINLLRGLFIGMLPVAIMVQPAFQDSATGDVLEQTGLILIITGILGRAWAILYIGGRKNNAVVTDGPYSLCRHPLYLFSSVAVLGFGLLLQSVTLAALMLALFGGTLYLTAGKEEQRLRGLFGSAYDDYARKTPRLLPALGQFHTPRQVTVSVDHLRGNFWDATVFVFLIPAAEIIERLREAQILPAIGVF